MIHRTRPYSEFEIGGMRFAFKEIVYLTYDIDAVDGWNSQNLEHNR